MDVDKFWFIEFRYLKSSCHVTAGKKSHLRKTSEKKPPTKESIAKLQQSAIWKMENEFYEFALEQFQFVRAHAVREKDGELYLLAQNFFYEKIYPKNWRAMFIRGGRSGSDVQTEEEMRRKLRLIVTVWLEICSTYAWKRNMQNNPPLTQWSGGWRRGPSCCLCLLIRRGVCVSSADCISFEQQPAHTSITKTPLPVSLEEDSPNSWSDIKSRSRRNVFLGSLLFGCVWLYFNSLILLSFCKYRWWCFPWWNNMSMPMPCHYY